MALVTFQILGTNAGEKGIVQIQGNASEGNVSGNENGNANGNGKKNGNGIGNGNAKGNAETVKGKLKKSKGNANGNGKKNRNGIGNGKGNFLSMRNLQEQVKKAFCYRKLF